MPVQGWIDVSDLYCKGCELCISACPITASTIEYLGPGVLAGSHQHGIQGDNRLLKLVDSEDGVWRCHSAFECSAVCPSFVEPGWRIMELRRQVFKEKWRQLFHLSSKGIPVSTEVKK